MFLVKPNGSSQRLAMKRLFVNDDQDLAVCKREIQILVRIWALSLDSLESFNSF